MKNVLLVTFDGVRAKELFEGIDLALYKQINPDKWEDSLVYKFVSNYNHLISIKAILGTNSSRKQREDYAILLGPINETIRLCSWKSTTQQPRST